MKLLPCLILASRWVAPDQISLSEFSQLSLNNQLDKFYSSLSFHDIFSAEAGERCCERTTRTLSGKRCQKWDSIKPRKSIIYRLQRHGFNKSLLYTYVNKTRRSFWNQKRTTGNINHNQCTFADPYDPKPFCFTTELGEQWEHCNCKACNPSFQISTTQTTITEGSLTFGTVLKLKSGRLLQVYPKGSEPGIPRESFRY